jgi:hypothetical protein
MRVSAPQPVDGQARASGTIVLVREGYGILLRDGDWDEIEVEADLCEPLNEPPVL